MRSKILVGFASVAYCFIVLFCFTSYIRAGESPLPTSAFVIALGPAAIYLGLRWPLSFPFCLYILFMPFESLSRIGSVGSLEKMLGIASAAAILFSVLRKRGSVSPPRAMWMWLTLLLYMTLSIFWAVEPSSCNGNYQEYASNIALFSLLSIVRVKRWQLNIVLGAAVLAGTISAGYDAFLYHSNQDVMEAEAGASRVVVSLGDALIDPNQVAAALVLPFSIALYWIFNARFLALRALMLPVLMILMLGFAASGSRGGLIDLVAVFFYLIVRSRHRLKYAALFALSSAIAVLANPGLPLRFIQAQKDGAAGRSSIWHVGFYAFRDHWLIGAGVGNFSDAYDREYIHVFQNYVIGWHPAAHNVPLTIATELGVIGFVIFSIAIVAQLSTLRRFCTNASLYELRLSLEAAVIGVLVAGLSISAMHDKYLWLAFSMMALLRGYELTNGARPTVAPKRHLLPAKLRQYVGSTLAPSHN